MSIGLGIHGEPGLASSPLVSAPSCPTLLDPLLEDRPDDADGRVAVIVNGLGATKYEELFLLFGRVAGPRGAGLTLVEPEWASWSPAWTWPAARLRCAGWTTS